MKPLVRIRMVRGGPNLTTMLETCALLLKIIVNDSMEEHFSLQTSVLPARLMQPFLAKKCFCHGLYLILVYNLYF